MPYDYKNILQEVKAYYEKDPLQKRFSAIVYGNIGVGKTYLLSTARKPIHIDSFDPGGTKCLRDQIISGDVIADTRFESEDPFNPTAFALWMREVELRFQTKYFDHFGTYCLDSSTKFMDAAMNYQLNSSGHAGETPRHRHDYNPTKTFMVNYTSKLMNLPCDFILTGHFRENEELLSVDSKTGVERKKVEYRFLTIGQAATTIPLMFDEIYVLQTIESSGGLKRELLLEAQGQYLARSRLRANGKLDSREPADIKLLLKKIGLSWEDKPKLVF